MEQLDIPGITAQRNFTNPESRIMPASGGKDFLQAYNCQAVVDPEHQVIVATGHLSGAAPVSSRGARYISS